VMYTSSQIVAIWAQGNCCLRLTRMMEWWMCLLWVP